MAGVMLVLKGVAIALGTTIGALLSPVWGTAAAIGAVVAGLVGLVTWIGYTQKAANQRRSPSFIDIFLMLPEAMDKINERLQIMIDGFTNLVRVVAEFVGGMADKAIRLLALKHGTAAAEFVETGRFPAGGINERTAAAATDRNITNNTTNTVMNQIAPGAPGEMKAVINMTVDLGKNKVFEEAVLGVLYAQER